MCAREVYHLSGVEEHGLKVDRFEEDNERIGQMAYYDESIGLVRRSRMSAEGMSRTLMNLLRARDCEGLCWGGKIVGLLGLLENHDLQQTGTLRLETG